jgi:hypothetical protein
MLSLFSRIILNNCHLSKVKDNGLVCHNVQVVKPNEATRVFLRVHTITSNANRALLE